MCGCFENATDGDLAKLDILYAPKIKPSNKTAEQLIGTFL